jgi:DivIVA domain-containing protein
MTDNEFHLTPVDIRNQEFPRGLRGFDTAAVEEFRGRVADELERLLREKTLLEERVYNFREQLKAFREREKAMSEALVAAQQLRAEAERVAQRESELVIQQARTDADRILADARAAEIALQRDTEGAHRQFTGYLAAFRHLLERNMAEIDALATQERNGDGSNGGGE